MNPGVGYTLGGGFHCTTFDCILRIFQEGLRPGGGGDRINTFFVPFAPWDNRSWSILKYKKIEGANLVYIYLTYESLAKFSPRVSADGHILVQQTIPFSSFDAVWYREWESGEYYRLLVPNGQDQLVLSVDGAKKMATTERFDNLIRNVVPDETSPDVEELRKLIDIQTAHISNHCNLFPKHPGWNNAVSLLALTHRSLKEDHRLCPACLCEIPANLSICVVCKGHLISHGFRKRMKVTIASVPTVELRSPEGDVKDHVKQAWEEIKIELTSDDDEEADHKVNDDEMEEIEMESPPEGSHHRTVYVDADEGKEELTSEKRDYRQQDDVDQFLKEEREQAETHGEGMEMQDDDENRGFRAMYMQIIQGGWNALIMGRRSCPLKPAWLETPSPSSSRFCCYKWVTICWGFIDIIVWISVRTALKPLGSIFKRSTLIDLTLTPRSHTLVKMRMAIRKNPLMIRWENCTGTSVTLRIRTILVLTDSLVPIMDHWYSRSSSLTSWNAGSRTLTCRTRWETELVTHWD